MISLLSLSALATSGFDPSAPQAVFTGSQVENHTGTKVLWSRVERYGDPDRTLFEQQDYNAMTRWSDSEFTPYIASMFGSPEPHSSQFLLHHGVGVPTATGTPILLVHGAGDNASRAWGTLREVLEAEGRPVFAITFSHPHGDVLRQAESVANAIDAVKYLTGSTQVDLVAHSKGGMAVAAYTSHTDDADWGRSDYESVGTPYRNDVRRVVYVGTPLGGIDTSYRWSAMNFLALDVDLAISPSSWSSYYPFGSSTWWVETSLEEQDHLAGGGDLFPGQRQLLYRQDHPLPGTLPWIGGYAIQQDWYTTYEGGFGLFSWSDGIDDAIADGDHFIERLADQGMDPRIDVFQLAGANPMMPNGDEAFRSLWDGLALPSQWDLLLTSVDTFVADITWNDAETRGLSDGYLVLGEVSGESDGLLFVDSATATWTIDARGVDVVEQRVVDVSHTELLIASAGMGAVMHALAGDDPEQDWMKSRGDRYIEADTSGWIADVLADTRAGSSQGRGEAESEQLARDEDFNKVGCNTAGGWSLSSLLRR